MELLPELVLTRVVVLLQVILARRLRLDGDYRRGAGLVLLIHHPLHLLGLTLPKELPLPAVRCGGAQWAVTRGGGEGNFLGRLAFARWVAAFTSPRGCR